MLQVDPVEASIQTGSKSHLGLTTPLRDLGMTSNELREIIADALEGAAERLRSGIVAEAQSKREAKSSSVADPPSDVTEHVLKADDVARILGVRTGSVYKAIKAGEMPALHVGRRVLEVVTQRSASGCVRVRSSARSDPYIAGKTSYGQEHRVTSPASRDSAYLASVSVPVGFEVG